MNQARRGLGERHVVEAESGQEFLAEVHDQDIGLGCEPLDDVHGCRLLEVEGDAALVAVQGFECGREAFGGPPETSQRVSYERLDLDDVGAHVSELQRRRGSLDVGRHVEHLDAVERCHRVFLRIVFVCSPGV